MQDKVLVAVDKMFDVLKEAGEAAIAEEFKSLYSLIITTKNKERFAKEGEIVSLEFDEKAPYVNILLLLSKCAGEDAYYKFTLGIRVCEYNMLQGVDVNDKIKVLDDILEFIKYMAFMVRRFYLAPTDENKKKILLAMFI